MSLTQARAILLDQLRRKYLLDLLFELEVFIEYNCGDEEYDDPGFSDHQQEPVHRGT